MRSVYKYLQRSLVMKPQMEKSVFQNSKSHKFNQTFKKLEIEKDYTLQDLTRALYQRLQFSKEKFEQINNELIHFSDQITKQQIESYRKQLQILQPLNDVKKDMESQIVILNDLKQMLNEKPDKETIEFAQEEIKSNENQLEEIQKNCIDILIPQGQYDNVSEITIEIRPGVGGSESSLFAEDLLNMYSQYLSDHGLQKLFLKFFSKEIFLQENTLFLFIRIYHPINSYYSISCDPFSNYKVVQMQRDAQINKGCKLGQIQVTGEEIYKIMKCESGVHKVIRVPETQQSGRLHSSAVSVVVLPDIPMEFKINDADLQFEYMRSSGPGGQSVNKTESACRVTHIPTGMSVFNQQDRNQIRNKQRAIELLKEQLFQIEIAKHQQRQSSDRKEQIGSSDRSDQIRTYNFPQTRITDHRTNITLYGIEQMMEGELLDQFIQAYLDKIHNEKLQILLEDLQNQAD